MKQKIVFGIFVLLVILGITIENSKFFNTIYLKDSETVLSSLLDDAFKNQTRIINQDEITELISSFDVNNQLKKQLIKNNFSLYVYKNNCLYYWSDNRVINQEFTLKPGINKKIISNQNGWFQLAAVQKKEYTIYCVYNFYRMFPIQNVYFKNVFDEKLNLKGVEIDENKLNKGELQGNYFVHQKTPKVDYKTYIERKSLKFSMGFYTLVFMVYLMFCYLFSKKEDGFNIQISINLVSIFIIVSCLLLLNGSIFIDFTKHQFFSPEIAAYNSLIPSFGHGFIWSIIVFFTSVLIYLNLKNSVLPKKLKHFVYYLLSFIRYVLLCLLIFKIVPIFINNSQINYNVKELSNLDIWSLIGLVNLFILFLSWLFFSRFSKTFAPRKTFFKNYISNIIISIFTVLGFVIIYNENLFLSISIIVFVTLFSYINLKTNTLKFNTIILITSLFAGLISIQLEQVNSFKEKEQRKLYANKIISKQNIDLELNLLKIEKEIIGINTLEEFFYYKETDFSELELNYKYTFFNDLINEFDIDFLRFDNKGKDITVNNFKFDYLNNLYNNSERSNICNYFTYIKDINFSGAYLLKFDVCPGEQTLGYVFLMLTPKVKTEPYNLDYFFSNKKTENINYDLYSFGVYKNDYLVKAQGVYPYKIKKDFNYEYLGDESFVYHNNFSHYYKRIDQESFLLISKKDITNDKLLIVLTFTFLFYNLLVVLVFVALYGILFIVKKLNENGFQENTYIILAKYFRLVNIRKIYLETKIRLYFMLLTFGIFVVVLLVVLNNVNTNFKAKQNDLLDKKTLQISDEIELMYQRNEIQSLRNLIKDLANRFELDINLYNTDGTLLQTANNRIFFEGWFSKYMNSDAYKELVINKQYQYKQKEQLSKLNYISSYNSIFDKDRKLVGFVNIPYFSRDIDLKNQFSGFLSSLLNITALLLIISIFLAVRISSGLVKPLKMIIESLAKIRLGSTNRQITLKRNDEIGQLVDQYNFMLQKLENSTRKLALSEREGAWREMAKQVAHEIKNPLTPMKLHLQHLQLSINRNDENLLEKTKNISHILIEQIDQLSRMAEEFSSFAKMPITVSETINLNELLTNTIDLFKSHNTLDVEYTNLFPEVLVVVDKQQLQRVFTNIIKNAHQAAKENESCFLKINVESTHNEIIISFKDNGKGIDAELKEKVFMPNFSTKNSGMGLGLSICKKIIEEFNGDINFESETNEGTIFYIKLPKIK